MQILNLGILLEVDVFAWTVVVVGYSVVFFALILLYFIYSSMPKVLNAMNKTKRKKEGKEECKACEDITGEVNAAISMALFMYFNELHDEESGEVTIKEVSKRYSPWSSKLYGMNKYYSQRN
ncbi:MAG: OadG family protein [Bacteroidales bacterium]|nr:OadG family protein [Bacteroidales bacterium]